MWDYLAGCIFLGNTHWCVLKEVPIPISPAIKPIYLK